MVYKQGNWALVGLILFLTGICYTDIRICQTLWRRSEVTTDLEFFMELDTQERGGTAFQAFRADLFRSLLHVVFMGLQYHWLLFKNRG